MIFHKCRSWSCSLVQLVGRLHSAVIILFSNTGFPISFQYPPTGFVCKIHCISSCLFFLWSRIAIAFWKKELLFSLSVTIKLNWLLSAHFILFKSADLTLNQQINCKKSEQNLCGPTESLIHCCSESMTPWLMLIQLMDTLSRQLCLWIEYFHNSICKPLLGCDAMSTLMEVSMWSKLCIWSNIPIY